MKTEGSVFKSTLKSLLNERLSEAEVQSLRDEGFCINKPTRKAAIMIALYKKATSGDLSAIKELISIANDGLQTKGTEDKAVKIIDDIGN